jgi:hypothetical protein
VARDPFGALNAARENGKSWATLAGYEVVVGYFGHFYGTTSQPSETLGHIPANALVIHFLSWPAAVKLQAGRDLPPIAQGVSLETLRSQIVNTRNEGRAARGASLPE